ncbi:Immunoglobulin I-set domain protein [Sedimentisphaera cyanobacteriorum]|uniref:Immunoglobulin I-set domain protein n=1 Tax=Sedimentisphaera cyanobacteriorum TaxID=1940790 RepID=A0A1Q2HQ67_9BACT|nr:LamG-like jellyroll fold domain-containing protein [Sedimentisphaera cyanobacteriorum]AQQ09434.1 Immunoglobulin I-set domain protein [Sedimentisphaera cyanobacteriorum]
MTNIYKILVFICCLAVSSSLFAGAIVPGFDDAQAMVDYTERQCGNADDMGGITGSGTITLAAKFTPSEADTTKTDGPVVILEVGGVHYGNGIYICDGMLTFASKGANGIGGSNQPIDGLYDTDASDSTAAVVMAPVYPNIETEVVASFNTNTGELTVLINGRLYTETISGTSGSANLSGNTSVTFLGFTPEGGGNCLDYGGLGTPEDDVPELLVQGYSDNLNGTTGMEMRGQIFDDVIDMEQLPRNPVPANGAVNVDPAAVTSLQFDTAGDPANTSNPNPDVTGHFVTAYSTYDPEDPSNNVEAVSAFLPAGSDPLEIPISFSLGDEIYWQVEEQISGAAEGSPSNITGPIWHFEALPAIPAITDSPEDAADFPGSELTFNAAFTSKTPAAVEWVKAGDPETIVDDFDADITISVSQHGDSYASSLTVSNIEKADQGEYFCRASNTNGNADSDSARLGVKRMIGYWPLDGDYLDYSGDEHHADPNTTPLESQWVDGVDPASTGQALDTEPNALAAAETEPFEPAKYTSEISITFWLKWAGPEAATDFLTGLVCSTDRELENNWWFGLNQDGQIAGNTPNYNPLTAPIDNQITPGEWSHLAFVNNEDSQLNLYVNGALVAASDSFEINKHLLPVQLMCDRRDQDGVLWRHTPGVFDEIKMYNYALTTDQIAQEYYDITGESFCKDPYSEDLQFDFNGDCKVDLADFAMMAVDWNESNLYPQLD